MQATGGIYQITHPKQPTTEPTNDEHRSAPPSFLSNTISFWFGTSATIYSSLYRMRPEEGEEEDEEEEKEEDDPHLSD